MNRTLALSLVLVLASCGQRTPEGQADRDQAPASAPAAPTPIASDSEPPAATPAGPDCPRPVVVSPRALATGWPGLIGKRVRLRVAPVRAIGFTSWLVVADGQRFIVEAAPGTNWAGEHVFVVAGAAMVALGGRTSLPELALDDGCGA